MAYYRRIRDMREDHDLTQRQLAALLHMPQPQYNRYEPGLRDLPTTNHIALADIYHTSTAYLLGRTNDPKPPVSLYRTNMGLLCRMPLLHNTGWSEWGDAARFLVFSGKCAQIF